ncbi:MAG: ATP-binding cassette domain-containing protein [Alphaproteobacteria bacterium]|jgi:ATPase subunit of ABC transporter with duplicated ATPase domains|nr:ATP-binding cassette domain-containing protein [Candidatus Jidaibacter sp.]
MPKHINITDLSISFGSKTYIEKFSTNITHSSRIGVIGRNGAGKTSLLNSIASHDQGMDHVVKIDQAMKIGYLAQITDNISTQSHGEFLISTIASLLRDDVDVLILDEPTNHLDKRNRQYLFNMLDEFDGILIFISHDPEMLDRCANEIWHLKDGHVHISKCKYSDYIRQIEGQRDNIAHQVSLLNKEKEAIHNALMKEQERASKSRKNGQNNIDNKKWPTVRSKTKFGRASTTYMSKKSELANKRSCLNNAIADIEVIKTIKPTFHLNATCKKDDIIFSVQRAGVGYMDKMILNDLYITLRANSRIAVVGYNGSGKSTLLKAIIDDRSVIKSGAWYVKNGLSIGYLDQNYCNITQDSLEIKVIDVIRNVVPGWSNNQIREHLNSFLFQKNDEVNKKVFQLSGGERARLSLAKVAAKSPDLLVLDEITNNLDIETKSYLAQALNHYRGALIIVSHEDEFIECIAIEELIVLDKYNA